MQWIYGGLAVVAAVNVSLALLVLGSNRDWLIRSSLATLLASTGAWAFSIMQFLQATNSAQATFWIYVVYISAAVIAPATFIFGMVFPKRLALRRSVIVSVGVALALVIILVMQGHGMITEITRQAGQNAVVFSLPRYFLYVAYYVVLSVGIVAELVYGARLSRRAQRSGLMAQLQYLTASIVLALGLGLFFDLFLPLIGEYRYIWVGPLCTMIFTAGLMYTAVRQGLFDLRQASVRSISYILLFGSVLALGMIAVGVSDILVRQGYVQDTRAVLLTQLVVVALLALVAPPLKKYFDNWADAALNFGRYDSDLVLETVRRIGREQTNTDIIVQKSIETLASALQARFVTAFIYEHEAWRELRFGERLSPHRRATQDAIISAHAASLPLAGRVHEVDQLRDPGLYSLLIKAGVHAVMRLESQNETIAVILFGAKNSASAYDMRDYHLLSVASSDLSLAVESSMRFGEIERFTATLEARIAEATNQLQTSNRELKKLDATKDEFISMASHQLRTPLTSVKGYIDMVLEGDAGKITPMQKKLLAQAFESSERMVHLINDFLNVSRLQTGKFMLEIHPTDLSLVARQEVDSLLSTAKSHDVRLLYRAPRHLPVLMLDENKIRQVMMNFIDNAIYYSPASTTIEIKLQKDGPDIVFTVHDHGIGVPKAEQKHLFTKFFRASNARKQRPDGTGVGLFLAQKVIDAHGGQVIFESNPGEGSVFGFRLPIAKLIDLADESDDAATQQKER